MLLKENRKQCCEMPYTIGTNPLATKDLVSISSTHWHRSQDFLQWTCIYLGFASHSPICAQYGQFAGLESTHSFPVSASVMLSAEEKTAVRVAIKSIAKTTRTALVGEFMCFAILNAEVFAPR